MNVKKVYDVLLATIIAFFGMTVILFFGVTDHLFIKINLFLLLITLFVSYIGRKRILADQPIRSESKILMAVMMFVVLQYIFGSFFILGRLFVESFIK